ncbi:MAG TPA: phosphonoacetaldehyde reductase [Myxococcota bacterium]|nr:phosphonoacetaldehyde reductase [Myxococcota bacterium]
MVRLFHDAGVLPQLLDGETPLFITMPGETLRLADPGGVVSDSIRRTGAIHLSYAGTALPVQDVQRLYRQVIPERCSIIVAVGGGTVIDIAKIIGVAVSNRLPALENLLDNPAGFVNTVPTICVPTTCGTGSEATHFAVVYSGGRKYSIAHQSMRPGIAILDWRFLVALPERIRNATVLDALSQAIESIWAKGSNDDSRQYAVEAVGSILRGLDATTDADRLKSLQDGSYLSGKAIDISKTTAAHAISYPLTARFGIPHGIAVFLTLPGIAELNYQVGLCDRFKLLFDLFHVDSISAFQARLRDIMAGMGFSARLSDWGVADGDLSAIAAESITPGRSDNNPAVVSPELVLKLLRSIM